MEDFSDKIHIGELIAVSGAFQMNTFRMLKLLENGLIEVFESKDDFLEKYGSEQRVDELDWCELNNGKVFLNKSEEGK